MTRINRAAARAVAHAVYAILASVVLVATTAVSLAQQLPLAPTGDLYAGWSLLESLDVSNLNAITLKESRNTHGEGFTFDAAGNMYVGVDGLDTYDKNFNLLGHADAPPTPSARSFFVALRRPGQLFACNPTVPFARLFVFDTGDLRNPALTNIVDIPFTNAFGGQCRSIAFDSTDHLWVASYVYLIKLTLDSAGNPIAEEHFYQAAGNPFGLAFQPSTGLLFYSGVNSNLVATVDPVNPSVTTATITNVCDNANNSPLSIAFSSSGNMFVGCSNYDSAVTDIVAFPAARLVSITGVVDASTLAPVKVALDIVNVLPEFLAFKPASGPLYHLCLLYDPFKIAKSGSTIPIKLQLCDSSGNNLSSSSIVLHAVSLTKVSDSTSGSVNDSGNANPDGDFRYAGGGYIFNLSTKGLSAGTYTLAFTAGNEPSVYQVQFQVKS
ncbi:MAG: hypothetical protein M3167_08375 [Acidobacteriota bacterium]|nr:hypothetical protein [Acidobacteriota bacterium]